MESSYQPIIPGLPDDLALRCLAKIPHGYHGCLETVSKRWRDVLRSTEYSSYKAKQGWSGDWIFLLTENSKEQWIAYDPDANRWHPIPLIPRKEEYARSDGFGCVCVGNRFLVIGGAYSRNPKVIDEKPYITNQVFQFDTFTKEWSEAASMRTPRAGFGCCVMSGKVYVCGGRNMSRSALALAEVYDPLTNKWEELPQMHNNLRYCSSLSYNGKLAAFDVPGRSGNGRHRLWDAFSGQKTEIFDPSKHVWRTEQVNWPWSTFGRAEVQVTQDGRMYADVHEEGGENVVKTLDNKGEWHVVAQVPPLGGPPTDYSRVFGAGAYGFVAFGNELCVLGGRVWMFCAGVTGLKILNLDRGWIWGDGKWRETRPLCRPACATVKGFAALKETKNPETIVLSYIPNPKVGLRLHL